MGSRYDRAVRVDRIFEGGRLLTTDRARARATALAVLGGRIVAVGDGDELRRHPHAERVVSLPERTVVPGFNGAHNHMPAFGMGLGDVPLSSPPVGSVEDILRAVNARAPSQPAGSGVIGGGYDQNELAERRHPTAAELDAVAPDHLDPGEALTPEDAIRCYTLHSAGAAFREGDLGSLEPGKLADFAVLSGDPTAIAPEEIAAIEVLATVVGGGVAYDRMGLA